LLTGAELADGVASFCGKTHPNRKPDRKAAKELPMLPIRMEPAAAAL
jgi:hypothetical protein